MVVMVLDHVRDYFTDGTVNPVDLSVVSPSLFLTRWVTHFCAPAFAFLAGTGAYLAGTRGKTRNELAWFLLTRGLWLVILDLTVVKFGLLFTPAPRAFFAIVFWSIGWSLVVLAGLVYLSTPIVTAFGVLMICTHNLLDRFRAEAFGYLQPLWMILHQQGLVGTPPDTYLFVVYPLIPWIGVVAAGYGFGAIMLLAPARRKTVLFALGLGLTAAFVALRGLNVYGDPTPWSEQRTPLYTALSFLNCQKYPPSLLFLLMTLGPAIAFLAVCDDVPTALARPLITLGRVPLFYYLLQWYVIHSLAIALAAARGVPFDWLFGTNGPPQPTPESQYSLATAYLLWVVVLAIMYPICRWYAGVKAKSRSRWLSYL